MKFRIILLFLLSFVITGCIMEEHSEEIMKYSMDM